jgi:hypothetical protein
MLKLAGSLVVAMIALLALVWGMLFLYPRPPDTTEPGVFAGDGALLDYCALPELDDSGPRAVNIPKAYTPGCGWNDWPMPVLARCTEPLAPGVQDLRGLWRSVDPAFDHIERIEQCGDRTVVTSSGIIHDFRTDGTLANGSRDIEPPRCMNTWVAIEWRSGVMEFRPFGLPAVAVTRERQGDQLVWHYPGRGEVRMNRICRIPETHRSNGGRSPSAADA